MGLNPLFLTVPKCGFLPGNEKLLALLALVKPEVWTLKEKCILVSLGTGGNRENKPGHALVSFRGPSIRTSFRSFLWGTVLEIGNFLLCLVLRYLLFSSF